MTTTILTQGHITWTNIVHPSDEDIHQLSERYPQFHPLNLHDCLTDLEYPKLDHHDDYLFLVVQFPYWDADDKISRPAEVDIFITTGTLVTSHRGELKPLVKLFETAQNNPAERERLMGRGASPLLYEVLNALVNYCFPILKKVDDHIRDLEERMFGNNTRDLLNRVAIVRRDVISLRRILDPQPAIIHLLEAGNWHFIHEELNLFWSDIEDHLTQLCAMINEHSEVIGGLSDTIDTLASHRIDEVVRVLTIVTVLTLPVTVLSTIFSMNIVMPFAEHPLLFYFVLTFGLGLATFLIVLLWKNKWF